MPHRTRAEERIDEIDISPTKLLADIEQLQGELDASRSKADEFLAGLQRERAEFTNYRRRTSEEREAMLGLAGEDLIRKVIAIADDFDLAIDNRPPELAGHAWVDGVTAIDRKLRALLDSEGVRPVEAEPGRAFDPREHEAIATVPGTGESVSINTVNVGKNSQYYVDNSAGAAGYNTSMDGLTVPLTCSVAVKPGVATTVKIAVADTSDHIYDSAVALVDKGIWSD